MSERPTDLQRPSGTATVPADAELPVVARLVVEVRSDGTRTVARGALEDVVTGQRTDVEAHGSTPMALALALVRRMTSVTAFARRAVRAFLPPGDDPRRR